MEKFTVIIPTRERADTLYHSLKTCVMQEYPNLDILVSDNFSRDGTKDIVEAFHDSRIKYINPGKRISMSHNWEFALERVKEGYVLFLGDDDGLLPGSITEISQILAHNRLMAINWKSDQYLWPSFNRTNRANLLKISLDNKIIVAKGSDELVKLINCENGYERVPWLYKGFVHIDKIQMVKKISGNFFHSMIPDVYSGIALANVIDEYFYSFKPYSLDGISGHSNGASYAIDSGDKIAAKMFLSEKNIPLHEGFLYQSAYLLTAESVFQAISHKVLDPNDFSVDISKFFEAAMKEVEREPNARYSNVVDSIFFTASYFRVPIKDVDALIRRYPNRPFDNKHNINIEGFNKFKNRVEVDANKFSVENIFDAAILHQKINKNPSKYLQAGSVILSTSKFIIREIRKRYL
jgi:glycosyltransferase involved in cell wall biosynthesis